MRGSICIGSDPVKRRAVRKSRMKESVCISGGPANAEALRKSRKITQKSGKPLFSKVETNRQSGQKAAPANTGRRGKAMSKGRRFVRTCPLLPKGSPLCKGSLSLLSGGRTLFFPQSALGKTFAGVQRLFSVCRGLNACFSDRPAGPAPRRAPGSPGSRRRPGRPCRSCCSRKRVCPRDR